MTWLSSDYYGRPFYAPLPCDAWLKMDDPRLEGYKADRQEIFVTVEITFFSTKAHSDGGYLGQARTVRVSMSAQWEGNLGWVHCYKIDDENELSVDPLEICNQAVKSKVIRWQPMPEPFEGDT
jgi:hypothetical protein